jgi:hypothetical protein
VTGEPARAAPAAARGAPARLLADLGQGARGRIVEVRLPPGRRLAPESPLRPGAEVDVAEAPGGRWLHARIDFREYSVPVDVAEHVLVELPAGEAAARSPAASGSTTGRTPAGAGRRWPATRRGWTPPASAPATACPDRARGGPPGGR